MANVIEYTIRGVDKFSGSMGKVSSSLGGMAKMATGVAVAATAAATSVYVFASRVSAGMDIASKAARRLGESTEAFTSMQYAADMAGVSGEQFTKSMEMLNKNAHDAANGIGIARDALTTLGISATDFKNLNMEERLQLLADKMEGVVSPQEKLALATKLFGQEGSKMAEVVNGGGDAMRAMAADAKFLGVALSSQAGANAEALQDSFTRVDKAISGVSQAITNEMAPVLTGLSNATADAIAGMRGSIVEFVQVGIQNLFTFVEVLKQFKDGVIKAFTTREGFKLFLDGLGELVKIAGVAVIAFSKSFVYGFKNAFLLASDVVMGFGSWLGGALYDIVHGNEVSSFSEAMSNVIADGITDGMKRMSEDISPELEIMKTAFSDAGTVIAETFGINIDLAKMKAQEVIASISEFGTVAAETTGETVDNTLGYMEALAIRGEEWIAGMRDNAMGFATDFYAVMDGAIQSISDGIAQVIVAGGSFRDMFREVGKQVLQQLISMMIKLGIQRLILAGLTKGAIATESMSQMSAETGRTFASAFASTAAIPIIGPALAPGVAAASVSAMLSGAVGAAAAGSGVGAAIGAHGGMTNVPSEQTYLLDRGERVLSPNQNSDLKDFMSTGGGASGGVVIESLTIHILENATNADALLNMNKVDLDRIVAGPILESLNRLDKRGIRPESQERKRS